MGRNRKYSGYKAYDYLTPGVDYKVYKLREAIKKEWAYTIPLSKSEEERVEEIIEKNIVIDFHDHPVLLPEDAILWHTLNSDAREFMAYEELSRSVIDVVFDNMMDGSAYITSKHSWKWDDVVFNLGHRLCDIAHQDLVVHVKTVDEMIKAHETGHVAWVAVVESCSPIENEVDRLDILYGLGVRAIGITYSPSNSLGSGQYEWRDGGLTDLGYDAVVRMNKLGMLIDVSHTGDQTALDTIESSKTPICMSHVGAKALTPVNRHFPDNVIQALGEKEGVIGIEAPPGIIATEKDPSGSIEAFMEHIEHCINLIGIDYVACGPDSFYGDPATTTLYKRSEHYKTQGTGHYSRPGKPKDKQLNVPEYAKGIENPSECIHNVPRWMVKHGYSDEEIAKVIGGNVLQLLKKVW